MNMKEIMKNRGFTATEEESWNSMTHPAKNGEVRWGLIRKELKMHSPSDWGTGKYSIVGVEINTWDQTVGVRHLAGTAPCAESLFMALLSDRDVRRMISDYQNSKRKNKYRIWETSGMSGRRDIFLTLGFKKGGFMKTETKKICHISGFGKLNEKVFGDSHQIYVGDFVELVVYLGLTKNMDARHLRKVSRAQYILPRLAEEIKGYNTTVSKIL